MDREASALGQVSGIRREPLGSVGRLMPEIPAQLPLTQLHPVPSSTPKVPLGVGAQKAWVREPGAQGWGFPVALPSMDRTQCLRVDVLAQHHRGLSLGGRPVHSQGSREGVDYP